MRPQKARAIQDLLIRMMQSGQLRGQITEDQLIDVLDQVRALSRPHPSGCAESSRDLLAHRSRRLRALAQAATRRKAAKLLYVHVLAYCSPHKAEFQVRMCSSVEGKAWMTMTLTSERRRRESCLHPRALACNLLFTLPQQRSGSHNVLSDGYEERHGRWLPPHVLPVCLLASARHATWCARSLVLSGSQLVETV